MRILAALLVAWVLAGCSEDSPTRPRPAAVEFDSVAIVKPDTTWIALFVSNSGGATAYAVRVYWHSAGGGGAQVSAVEPPNLAAGQSGYALTMRNDSPAWTWPQTADSIRWSASP
jgi:hypothetical protein